MCFSFSPLSEMRHSYLRCPTSNRPVCYSLVLLQMPTLYSGVSYFKFPTLYPVGNYMFKVNSRKTRKRCAICSKLTIKTPDHFSTCIKYIFKIKTNPNICILMYFKIQSHQPRITQNALKSEIFDLFTTSSSGHK